MARKVDPARHEARRVQIIDAGLTVFAANGYDGATTAAICRQARIGSGTFFHYFPTKKSLLLAILAHGTQEEREKAAEFEGREGPLDVLLEIVAEGAAAASDPRMPGFVRAVGGIMNDPEVAAALARDEEAQRALLHPWVVRGQEAGEVRTDLAPERVVSWLWLFTDGFLERVAMDTGFDPARESALLVSTVARFLGGD